MKKLLVSFSLNDISLGLINEVISICYNKTGLKFWFKFNGSKGYLDNIEIFCEGHQSHNNIIIVDSPCRYIQIWFCNESSEIFINQS